MTDPIISPAAEAAIASTTSKAALTAGTGTTLVSLVAGADWVTLTGITVTVATAVVSLVFKLRQDARAREKHEWERQEHEARMRQEELESQMGRAVGVPIAQADK